MVIPIGGEYWISFKGECHFTNYYKMLYDWLISNGFTHRPTGTAPSDTKDEIEDYYSEIRMPSFSNHWIWWRVWQKAPNGDELFDFELDILFQTLALGKKEILVNGQKTKVDSGEINVKLKSRVVFHADVLTDNWLGKTLFEYLRWKHYEELISDHKEDMYDMTMEFYDRAKQGLGIPTFITELQEPFHPILGQVQQ